MAESPLRDLSRRERQIMEVVYARGRADAGEIQEALPDPPSYSAVRALLRILVDKGHMQAMKEGNKLVYEPIRKRDDVRAGIMAQVVETYFSGSTPDAVAALLDVNGEQLSREELDVLSKLIDRAKKEGR